MVQASTTAACVMQRVKLHFTLLTWYFSLLPLTLKDDAQILLCNVQNNFEALLPSELRSCNLSNAREQKATIKKPLPYLHASLHNHYPFWKGSARELKISGTMNNHKQDSAREAIMLYISSE